MKKQQTTHGALRARTRAFFCALTLALFSSATAFAGFDGDATSQSTGRDYTNKPFTNAEVTRTGTLYTFHKTYDTDNDGNALTYTITEHFEFYTEEPIPVGGKVYLLQCDRSGDVNTVRSYDPATATGSYYRSVPKSSGTTYNYYWTQSKTIFGIPRGLGIYHIAENEWFVVNGLANSNNQTYSNSYGSSPECTITFEVGGAPWNHGTLTNSSQSGNWGLGMIGCSTTPESGYKFGIWSNGLYYTLHSTFLPLETVTLTAYFVPESAESRTVTVTADAADGTAGVYYRAARGISILVVETSATVFEGVPVTLVATQTGSNPFDHWEDEGGNTLDPSVIMSSNTADGVTTTQVIVPTGKNTTYTAIFAPAAPVTPTYTVAATVSPAGAGTVTGTGTFDEGDDVTLTANPANRRYVFSHWTDEGNSAGTDGVDTYTINDIAADHNNVVAVFTEVPVTLDDNKETSYYTTTASTFTGEMDFQMMRTFYAGMWNTVCFPFDLTASQIAASDMRTATFYTLTSVTGDAAEGLDFNVSEVTSLSARTPYLVQVSGANIVNPVFAGVTLAASAFTNNTTGTNVGDTRFFGTVHPTALETGENSGFLFLGQNNQLYWPNVANDIRAFRAYFYSGNSTVQAVHPRVRLVVRPETPTDVIEGYNADTWSAVVPARKVLDNGNLIIERDGIRYNAVGQKVN